MKSGASRGKREVCPFGQATRRAWGNLLPIQAQASNDCQSLYGSPGAAWQDKPVGRCKMDQ